MLVDAALRVPLSLDSKNAAPGGAASLLEKQQLLRNSQVDGRVPHQAAAGASDRDGVCPGSGLQSTRELRVHRQRGRRAGRAGRDRRR